MLNKLENIDFQTGQVVLIDKDTEWTSFDVVNKIRILIRRKYGYKKIKVGHAGTLDPLATGLLIICTGKATKTISDYQNSDKEYVATFRLGQATPSYDAETEVDKECPYDHIKKDQIIEILSGMIGESEQVPPDYSAKHIDGKRAYMLARKGKPVNLKPQTVRIDEAELLEVNLPEFKARILCSKGTYIRAIARDIGEKLDSCAYLKGLRRTKIGNFEIEEAVKIEDFEKMLQNM